jgi:hypothetical protein
MAGSYQHILGGWSLIDNMHDANEAVEELLWLVQSQIGEEKASQLLDERYYPMLRGELEKDEHLISVQKLMEI